MLSSLADHLAASHGEQFYIWSTLCILAPFLIGQILRQRCRMKVPRIGKNPWISGLGNARADFFKNGRRLTAEGYSKVQNPISAARGPTLRTVIVQGLHVCDPDSGYGTRHHLEQVH